MVKNRTRVTLYIKEGYRDKYDEILNYMGKLENGSIQNASEAVFEALMAFHQIFIESQPDEVDFLTRINQIKGIVPKDSQKILADLAIVKKQNDRITYQNLALNQKLGKNPNWKPEYLQSVYSSRDMEQVELIETIEQLISEDRARGQVVKNSH